MAACGAGCGCRVQRTAHTRKMNCVGVREDGTLSAGLSGYMEEELAEVLSVLTKTHKHLDMLTKTCSRLT